MENLIGLLLLAAVALGNWLLERQRTQKAERKQAAKRAAREAGAPSGEEKTLAPSPGKETDEEKQIRRFFEALGLPPEGQSPVPPFAPSSGRERMKRREAQRKAPASPAPTAGREAAPLPPRRETPPVSRPLQAPRRRPIPSAPPRPEPVLKREAHAPSSPFGPEAKPPVAERPSEVRTEPLEPVETVRSEVVSAARLEARVAAIRRNALSGSEAPPSAKGAAALRERSASPARDALRRRLRDVRAVQEAYILREILGPPKALQE
ncbi:MAG TPA: hypothetical protein VNQ90_11035 [Chthoniobacteraceae bacterium]|nr:hypothetical protein [Chthoniobacteraceae bacterium]